MESSQAERFPVKGGYPEEIFVHQNAIEKLKCPIDLGVLRDPVVDPCGHSFCKSCIEEWLLTQRSCPLSKKRFDYSVDLAKNFTLDALISSLEIRCLNFKRSCNWVGTIETLESHIQNDCLDVNVKCLVSPCEKYVLRKNLLAHQSEDCLYTRVNCPFFGVNGCQETFLRKKGGKHFYTNHLGEIMNFVQENCSLKEHIAALQIELNEKERI